MKRLESIVIGSLLAAFMMGCTVGPNYKRPVANTPASYRGAMAPEIQPQPSATPQTASLGDEKWADIFQDPVLKKLIAEAIANNFDIKIAAQRVLEEEAQVGIVRSQQFPTINGGASYTGAGLPSSFTGTAIPSQVYGGGLTASGAWNLDFWGLYRRQTEAERAELLATEWAQRATQLAVISDVTQAYFQLRMLDEQLEVTQRTIEARKNSLQLIQAMESGGATSLADVRQAEELLYTAQANLPNLQNDIAHEEDALSLLLGRNPGSVERGMAVADQPHPETIPSGVPSQLLERRPDIQQSEAKLIAANARIGVAKAQFFPQLSLTAMGGSASNQLSSMFAGKNAYWYAAGSLSEPIFDGGRIRSNYHLSKAEEQEMLTGYQKAIAGALRDVSDALSSYQKTREFREQQEQQTKSAADAVRLARIRYDAGYTSYLEVLTNDTNLYSSQLTLAQAQQQEALSLVQVYTALGGGWQ
jgi:outer membrane protein, multidrug efflux system